MKRTTKAELERRNKRLSEENHALSAVLADILNGVAPDAKEVAVHDGHRTTYTLFRATSPTGGFLLTTIRFDDADCDEGIGAEYFETMLRADLRYAPASTQNAIGALRRARDRLFECEASQKAS